MDEHTTPRPGTTHTWTGPVTAATAEAPGFGLWASRVRLGPGSGIAWGADHGDEAVYVIDGDVAVDGRPLGPRAAAVLESGATATLRCDRGATVLHVGPHDPVAPTDGLYGAPDPDGHGVHLVGPRGRFAFEEPERTSAFYADSTCPTCRLSLLYSERTSHYVSPAHSHSQDELIYVLAGDVRMGPHRLSAGMAVMVAADHQYGFSTGPDGYAFLNYRRDASVHRSARTKQTQVEGGQATGMAFVNDVR